MLSLKLFQAGFCTHCERMTRQNGRFKTVRYPSLCALIKHPRQGYVLYDTGYSERFDELTKSLPQAFYRWLTPMTLEHSLVEQLALLGIEPYEINTIIISHFHADHLGGLKDFPKAQFICHQSAWHSVRGLNSFKALRQAFLPDLLPNDFSARLHFLSDKVPLPNSLKPFTWGYRLFDDASLLAVELPGHAKGHIGLFVDDGEGSFLIGDSCWHSESFKEGIMPSRLTNFIHDEPKRYKETLEKLTRLHHLNPSLHIIPSHCHEVAINRVGEYAC